MRIAATPPGTALIFGVARGDLRDDATLQVIEQPQGVQQAQPAGR